MSDSKVLPSPRHTVVDQFNKFEQFIDSVLVNDPNLNVRDTGGVMAPAFHAVNTPFTRDFVAGPLKRKAEALLAEVDRLEEVAVSMAVTPDEMSLLSPKVAVDGDLNKPAVIMARYISVMRDFIEYTLIDNPGFKAGVDEDGSPVEAELLSLYPMTNSYLRDLLPRQAKEIQRIVANACGVCSVMALSGDERLILNEMISKLEDLTEFSQDQEDEHQFHDAPAPGF